WRGRLGVHRGTGEKPAQAGSNHPGLTASWQIGEFHDYPWFFGGRVTDSAEREVPPSCRRLARAFTRPSFRPLILLSSEERSPCCALRRNAHGQDFAAAGSAGGLARIRRKAGGPAALSRSSNERREFPIRHLLPGNNKERWRDHPATAPV